MGRGYNVDISSSDIIVKIVMKKDYDGPLYAPWSRVVEGKNKFIEWLKKQEKKNES